MSERYQHLLTAVETGDEKAKTELAILKLTGSDGAEVDKVGAFSLLGERAAAEDGDALWILGLCYEYGIGISQDIERAGSLYLRSKRSKSQFARFLSENFETERATGVMKGSLFFFFFFCFLFFSS